MLMFPDSHIILYQGNNEFYNSHTAFNIISSIKIGFVNESVTSVKKAEPPKKWILYEIVDIAQIAIPPTMELRDDNSFISLVTDVVIDNISVRKKIKMTKPKLTFQPKGSNKLDKQTFSKYSRILINYIKGEPGDFMTWNEEFDISSSQEKELNEYFLGEVTAPMPAFNIKLVKWYPLEFSNINGLSYIKQTFTRQMSDEPIVKVENYTFFNYDESVSITLSYRLSESNLWASDFSKVIKYFSFSNKK